MKIRFDTRFFLARLPAGQEPAVDGEECVDLGWFTPAAALAAYQRGEIGLVFPTIKQLEQLQLFASTGELLELRRAAGRCCRSSRACCFEGRSHACCSPATPATNSRRAADPRRAAPTAPARLQLCCWAAITCVTALISARCVNACG